MEASSIRNTHLSSIADKYFLFKDVYQQMLKRRKLVKNSEALFQMSGNKILSVECFKHIKQKLDTSFSQKKKKLCLKKYQGKYEIEY